MSNIYDDYAFDNNCLREEGSRMSCNISWLFLLTQRIGGYTILQICGFGPMSGFVERRRFKRLKLEVEVELQYYDTEKNKSEVIGDSVSKNVSAGGLLVASDRPLDIEAFVLARFLLPNEKRYIMVLAKVVRVEVVEEGRKYELGISFVNYRKEDIERLNEFVESELEKGTT